MTIVAELYDSETGEIIARVIDRREARRAGTLMLTSSATNEDDARSIASAGREFCGTASTRRMESARSSVGAS